VDLAGAKQSDLSIARADESPITLDDIQVAQFLYLMLNNRNLTSIIDTITTKVVLILGRFTPKRKRILDGIRADLRACGYVPVMFDFDRPASRDFTETVVTLGQMARFIIADISDPASVAKELEAIVPRLAVPVQPLLEKTQKPYSMFADYWKYDWVLKLKRYADLADLRASLKARVIRPAERKARELEARRAAAL
jgi:hypothetical protein